MFTWICPKCGREVPPAYNDCPDCAAKTAQPSEAPAVEPVAPAPPVPAPAVQRGGFGGGAGAPAAAPPVEAGPPETYAPPRAPARPRPPGPAIPTWLLTIVFAFAFLGLGIGVYWLVGYFRAHGQAAPSATVESPAAKPGARTNPIQRYIEVSGVRFMGDPKRKEQTLVKFILINHSEAPLDGLSGNVTVWGRTQKSEEDAQGTFTFTTSLAPFESKEMTAPLTTKLKIYELPDWQNVTTDVQITAPGEASGGSPAPR